MLTYVQSICSNKGLHTQPPAFQTKADEVLACRVTGRHKEIVVHSTGITGFLIDKATLLKPSCQGLVAA